MRGICVLNGSGVCVCVCGVGGGRVLAAYCANTSVYLHGEPGHATHGEQTKGKQEPCL